MIRYALTCSNDHAFESWFQSADAFDKLNATGMLSCSVCGDPSVKKSVMAPRVAKHTKAPRPLSAPATAAEQAVRELRAQIEANSEDVGEKFADEARAIHAGDAPERSIFGQAKPKEAKALIEDGIPVTPLPFSVSRKNN